MTSPFISHTITYFSVLVDSRGALHEKNSAATSATAKAANGTIIENLSTLAYCSATEASPMARLPFSAGFDMSPLAASFQLMAAEMSALPSAEPMILAVLNAPEAAPCSPEATFEVEE